MRLNEFGEYTPDLENSPDGKKLEDAGFACPFLNEEFDENRLGREFLANKDAKPSGNIGYHQQIFGGHVTEGNFRSGGTSGGFGTWIGAELYKEGLIDGVIHVKDRTREGGEGPFSRYTMSLSGEEILSASRTKYHVIEYSEVLRMVRDQPGKRFLFVGLPCVIKSIRRLQLLDPVIRDAIAFTVALVCGHLKSMNWSLSLGWGSGIHPTDFEGIRYRTKGKDIPARAYVFTAYSGKREIIKDSSEVVGGKFNQGALMLNACNFCDDVVGETADLTVGDAWLPRFEMDPDGNNLLIVRNKEIGKVLAKAMSENRVSLTTLTEKEVVDAQAGGFRQRREGLSVRLSEYRDKEIWHPVKRVKPDQFKVPYLRRIIYKMRSQVTNVSRVAFAEALAKDDYLIYANRLRLLLKKLRLLEIISSIPRIARKQTTYLLIKIFKGRKT